MSRNFLPAVCLLFFFIFWLMSCVICEPSFAEESDAAGQNPLILFQAGKKFEIVDEEGKKFKSFTSPSFGYVGNILVVFAQAKENGEEKCEVVEGFAEFKSENEISGKFLEKSGDSSWTRRVVKTNGLNHCSGSPTAVFNNTNIFVFFNSSTTEGGEIKYQVISSQKTDDVKNGITWGTSEDLTDKINDLKEAGKKIPVSSGGSGLAINNSLIVPVWYTKSENTFFSVIISASKTDERTWELVSIKPSKEGKYPAVVEWGGKLIMMISCNEGIRKVYKYSKTQTTWTEAVGSISGVWGNTKERTAKDYGSQWGFITANIQIEKQESEIKNKKVMFLAQPVAQPAKKPVGAAVSNYKLHLWMTDNQRVFDAGAISTEIEKNPSSSLLFEKDSLFVAYETGKKEQSAINVKYLKDQLATVKHVLKTWDEKDKELLQSCFAVDGTLTTADECTKNNKIPINGLVGFLSNNYSNKSWGDEYWCVNATVTEGEGSAKANHVKEGLKFSGAGVGATWPVSKQGQNQRYHFANHVFTLLATVRIGSDSKEKNSILGIGLEGNNKNGISLWCNNEKWSVNDGKDTAETPSTTANCVKDGIYQVALTLEDKKVSVYINGNKSEELSQKSIDVTQKEKITHFYFGANSDTEQSQTTAVVSHVTITNVLFVQPAF